MKPIRRNRFAVIFALAVVGLMAVAGTVRAETYVGRLIAEDLFTHLKFSGRIAVWPVDATQVRQAGLTPSAAAMLADNIRVAVHQIGAAKGLTFVEREQISKVFEEQQFAHNAKDSEFETLAHEANADALVLISLERESPTEIVVSARLVKAKEPGVGQILATSKAYEVPMTQMAAAAPSADAGASNGLTIHPAPPSPAPAPQPPALSAQPQTISPDTVTPDTVTPTGAPWAGTTAYYAPPPPPPPAYAVPVPPPVPYVYPAARAYYPRFYYRPRVAVAYAPAYRGGWWRR